MKKYVILTSVLALTACGGGSGSGSVGGHDSISSEISNAAITGMKLSVNNEAERTAHVTATLGDDYYGTVTDANINTNRAATNGNSDKNICKSERDCNDIAFNNMKNWLIDNIDSLTNDNISNPGDLRQALVLAGFKNDLPGNWDDIKAWFFANRDTIREQAQDVFDKFGEHKEQKLSDVDFMVAAVRDNNEPNGVLKIGMDDNGKITSIILDGEAEAKRIGDTASFQFDKSYRYSLNNVNLGNIDFSNPENQMDFDFYIESDKQLSPAQIKERFLAELADSDLPTDLRDALVHHVQNMMRDGYDEAIEQTTFTTHLLGKEIGLRYADFGYADAHMERTVDGQNANWNEYNTMAGGYSIKKISPDNLPTDTQMTFGGSAVAGLRVQIGNWDEDDGLEKRMLARTDDATLTFNNGTEELEMNFSKNTDRANRWYDVKFTKDTTGNITLFYSNEDALSDKDFAILGYPDNKIPLDPKSDNATFETAYYGDAGVASEATAAVGFRDEDMLPAENGYTYRELDFNAAFGGLKK
ncbi:hypothetical protein HDR63_03970 [bacterium]|nr:hypothetical protein [bacterium]